MSILTPKFNEGDRVRVISEHRNPHYAQRFGTIVEVKQGVSPYLVQFDGDSGPTGGRWTDQFLVAAGPVPANEVTVDFSIDRYRTAREYAARAIGTKMKEEHQRTLRSASRGEKVNLLALNAALADAQRQNATRYGRSPDRRQGATELAHLQYIVQGSLSNVLDGLPPVDPGARSPKIKALQQRVDFLESERSTLTQAASDERRRLCAEINEYEAAVVAATSELEKITAARDTALQVLAYALGKIDEDLDRERVLGFWDAVEPGFRHDFDPQD